MHTSRIIAEFNRANGDVDASDAPIVNTIPVKSTAHRQRGRVSLPVKMAQTMPAACSGMQNCLNSLLLSLASSGVRTKSDTVTPYNYASLTRTLRWEKVGRAFARDGNDPLQDLRVEISAALNPPGVRGRTARRWRRRRGSAHFRSDNALGY